VYGDNVRSDLNFLVDNPNKTLRSVYHDAGSCWLLIDVAVREIRRLRRKLDGAGRRRSPKK
jgi:hypothetical protein